MFRIGSFVNKIRANLEGIRLFVTAMSFRNELIAFVLLLQEVCTAEEEAQFAITCNGPTMYTGILGANCKSRRVFCLVRIFVPKVSSLKKNR